MKIKLLVVLIGLQIILVLLDSAGVLTGVRSRLELWLLPIQIMSRETMAGIERNVRFISSFGQVFEQNESLQHEIHDLRQQISATNALQQEVKALQLQLATPVTQDIDLIAAKIIAFDRSDDTLSVMLNIGSEQGVAVGDAVVVGQSLFGIVTSATGNKSKVLPVIATKSTVPVYVQDATGNRVTGVVHGEFNTGMVLSQFVREKLLEPTEYVFSSGLDGKYPSGLLVGKISQVTSAKANLFQEALLVPLWDIALLDTVFVYPVRM